MTSMFGPGFDSLQLHLSRHYLSEGGFSFTPINWSPYHLTSKLYIYFIYSTWYPFGLFITSVIFNMFIAHFIAYSC